MQHYTLIETTLGRLMMTAHHKQLTGLYVVGQKHEPSIQSTWAHSPAEPLFIEAEKQIHEFFAGTRISFDLNVSATGTPFQKSVWDHLCSIGYGTTISYQELAHKIGKPTATRAVASAVGRNPHSFIIPCHRVIGSNGSLTGYASGIERKKKILDIEKGLPFDQTLRQAQGERLILKHTRFLTK